MANAGDDLSFINSDVTLYLHRLPMLASMPGQQPNKLVISPDNKSRMELNRIIHAELQERGSVSGEEHQVKVLTPRQDMTGVDAPGL